MQNSPETNPSPGGPEILASDPKKIEALLSQMSVEDQVRAVLRLQGKERLDFLYLSPKGVETARAIPPQEMYFMVKDLGNKECLPILSVLSHDQVQYFFDLEWWHGDKFLPERAWDWLELFDQCQDPQILAWFVGEEFDLKVMVLQSLIKVFKDDEMTDSYEGTEELAQFTLDSVYQIFAKIPDSEGLLKKRLMELRHHDEKIFNALMEAVIWYPVTETVEQAYLNRVSRTTERGIPEYKEAVGVYSRLDPSVLRAEAAELTDLTSDGRYQVAPQYPLTFLDDAAFFARCLSLIEAVDAVDSIKWQLAYLANKIMVADKVDPAADGAQKQVMGKALSYVNIGLELGAEGDPAKGRRLLEKAWMQPLFQAGYGRLIQLKWDAEKLLKENGRFVNRLLSPLQIEQTAALVGQVPKLGELVEDGGAFEWRDFESLEEVKQTEKFLRAALFMVRFAKGALDLDESTLEAYANCLKFPEDPAGMDLVSLTGVALARFVLFQEISCEPLTEPAAASFLQVIFSHKIDPGAEAELDAGLLEAFKDALLKKPLAWAEEDRENLNGLIARCAETLTVHFARLDFKKPIDWKFTRGLLIKD